MIADVFQFNEFPSPERLAAMRGYIKKTWKTLQRSHAHIVKAAKDEKIGHTDDQRWPIYISAMENKARVEDEFKRVLSREEFKQIEILSLPSEMDQITEHGLLYLPGDYVVPGGRFNEMYGWDSYFIVLGLLRDGEIELAKSQVDQLIYQIDHYGTILNANRSYLLSRSQPPFLTPMILAVYEQTQDQDWLRSLLGAVESHYYYWIVPPHLNQSTGLSRYCALGEGPAPEVLVSETDDLGRTHYDRIRDYYRRFEVMAYDVSLYYDKESDTLTDLFYKGDRSMRESGFDPSNRFGPFNIDIIHYAPVCLNALLYRMEQDIATILKSLGNPQLAESWNERAQNRHQLIDKFLWDEPSGLYLDYNFRTNERRLYEFATTFYPLWVGLASEKQAQQVVENLELFEAPGGLLTSTHVTGNQWDAPFGWAPLILIAVEGLYRYGYRSEADRIGGKFINLVTQEFEKTGTLLEKYDVLSCSSEVSNEIVFGYNTNEIGFGWTNGSVLELLALGNKI